MLIIFDWDGTLCDSVDHIVAAMQAASTEMALTVPSAAAIRDIVGLGLPQAIATLFPTLDEFTRQGLATAYSRHYLAQDQDPALLFEGAMETLLALRKNGIKLAIATGKSRRGLDRVLGGLGLTEFFDATRCADETRSKPHPQMLAELMDVTRKAPEEALMVGDTEYDLAMAAQAGMRSVAVSFGVHDSERLARYRPIAIVDQLPELLDLEFLARNR